MKRKKNKCIDRFRVQHWLVVPHISYEYEYEYGRNNA